MTAGKRVYLVDKYGAVRHPRSVIRDATKAMLLGKTECENRVYLNRRQIIWDDSDNLPAIVINTQDENITPVNGSKNWPRLMNHSLTLRVDIFHAEVEDDGDSPDVDDRIDRVCMQIEKILSRWGDRFDKALNGGDGADLDTNGFVIENDIMTGMNHIVEEGAEYPIGATQMFYTIEYETHDGYSPQSIAGEQWIDFEGLDIDVYTQPPDNADPDDDLEMEITADVDTV